MMSLAPLLAATGKAVLMFFRYLTELVSALGSDLGRVHLRGVVAGQVLGVDLKGLLVTVLLVPSWKVAVILRL